MDLSVDTDDLGNAPSPSSRLTNISGALTACIIHCSDGAVITSETLNMYQTTWQNIPEESRWCQNLKPHSLNTLSSTEELKVLSLEISGGT